MASLRDLFAGVRSTFVPQAPEQDDLIKLVRDNKLDDLKEAFDKHDLKPDNLLHSVQSPEMVDFLVGKGANVNQPYQNNNGPDEYGDPTPLLYAAGQANAETVKRLLHHGADPDNGGAFSSFPLGEAAKRQDDQQEAVVRALLDAGASTGGALASAVEKRATIGTITAMLENGANPNDRTSAFGQEPALSFAVMQGRSEVVDLLLDYGADSMEGNINDQTALHWANDPAMVDKLVARSADPVALINATDEMNDTALTRASTYGSIDMATKLLDLGADPALAMKGYGWRQAEQQEQSALEPRPGRKEVMHLVQTRAIEQEKQALRQTFAEVEQEHSPDVAEAPAPRRRMRL